MKKQSFSLSTWFFLGIILIFGAFTYLSFGESIYFIATKQTERTPFFVFKEKKDTENRAKATFPTKVTFDFPRKFDAFYLDNFPMRSFFINRFQKLRKKIKDDPRVIVGLDHWMYSNSSPHAVYAKTGNILGDFTGKTLLNEADKALFTRNMACQKRFFDHHKIRFIVMSPPNKISIYPEHLPKSYLSQQAQYIRYDQVEEILKELGIEYIDVKTPILANKTKGQVYFKTDTHWSQLGAYLGFKELLKHLGHSFPDMTGIDRRILDCGDIYNMSVSISKSCFDINDIPILPEDNSGKCDGVAEHKKILCTNPKASIKKHVLIVRDSMFTSLLDYTKRSFSKATLLWRSMHTEQDLMDEILKEKPDIVIYETGERFILEMQNAAICPDAFVEIERLDQRPKSEKD